MQSNWTRVREGKEPTAAHIEGAGGQQGFPDIRATFAPPHHAVLFNEDRDAYDRLFVELWDTYQPLNPIAVTIVRGIANTQWQIMRLNGCLTNSWNLALVGHSETPLTVAPELGEWEVINRASAALHTGSAHAHRVSRLVDHLELRIARLERRLRFVHANFPGHIPPLRPQSPASPKGPIPESPNGQSSAAVPDGSETMENKEEEVPSVAPDAVAVPQPLYISENLPEVIEYYRNNFPGREIIVLPPDDVANGVEIRDHLPPVPRIAA